MAECGRRIAAGRSHTCGHRRCLTFPRTSASPRTLSGQTGTRHAYEPHSAYTMAQDNHDWQIFQIHELNLRRHCNKGLIQIVASLRNEFDPLLDSHAYAQCLVDIAEARLHASEDFQQVELIAQIKAENPQIPWQQREINDLWKSYESQKALWYALQQFTEEQKRIRPEGVPNAIYDKPSWREKQSCNEPGKVFLLIGHPP